MGMGMHGRKVKQDKKLWAELFGMGGCPAHLFDKSEDFYSGRFCDKGYCCETCLEKSSKCKKIRCKGSPKDCSVAGFTREELRRLYKSRTWRDYSEFSAAVTNMKERREKGK